MGTDRRELVKMKVFVLFTFVFSTSLAFEVNLNPKSESDRGLCCLFFNAQSDCASRCSGRSCTDRCNVNCGVANTLCGSWTCSQVTSSCTTETTTVAATTTTAAATTTTTACNNAAQSVALGAACCAFTDCAEGFCDLLGGDAAAATNVCTAI